jgi:uncharacterized integral membrane protein (TIGR00698 family)
MSNAQISAAGRPARREAEGSTANGFWAKEDWWAIILGLGLVIAAIVLYSQGSSLKWLAVTPAKWSNVAQLGADLSANALRYLVQFAFWAVAFSIITAALGFETRRFLPSFLFLYVASLLIFIVGQWDQANKYNLEPPLVALALGLILANLGVLPRRLETGFRVELYIKTGIVLLGATLPLSLIAWAGPVAILQASIVSLVTFFVIFYAARWFGLDRRFAATLGVGGAVCGVSAAIAISGAVGGKKEDAPITITTVVIWAIVMIFVLPFAARALGLPTGVAGAWIGTSEFADAAGIAAAQAYGDLAGHTDGIAGTSDQAVWAFSLMKIVGRDVWIGIWAFVLAIVATTRWDFQETGRKPDAGEIWRRFPKFVIGFVAASILITLATRGLSLADYNKLAVPALVNPIKDLRTWAFIFCFFSIGLTTRFADFAKAGAKPFLAFTAGVVVNVALGFILSTIVFSTYWINLTR